MSRRDTMVMVFCYDIQEDRVRRRVADLLGDRCARVQKSVFEARMTEAAADALFQAVAAELAAGDSLRMYALSAAGRDRSRVAGATAPLAEDSAFWLL